MANPDELRSLRSLQNLTIKGCPRLVGCWEKRLFCLTSLRTLTIGLFSEELEYFPWPSTTISATSASASTSVSVTAAAVEEVDDDDTKYHHPNPKHYPFISLVSLTLFGVDRVKYLPDQLQHLTTLRDLSLQYFYGLETLPEWLGNLSSLHSLHLCWCLDLMNLPSLEAMQRLTNLRSLKIQYCPLMKERCARESGQEWHKIAHIPSIDVFISVLTQIAMLQGLLQGVPLDSSTSSVEDSRQVLKLDLSHQLDQLTLLEGPSASELANASKRASKKIQASDHGLRELLKQSRKIRRGNRSLIIITGCGGIKLGFFSKTSSNASRRTNPG
ncbi:hypothetical protein HYC85_019826 [Camellia sinensis]|uniref:R13L1/DRL21-like LRR repeat region domain-containing protein n=1 Tax=Camellia sinensis TaxID=4442 RepID=A0A7J7GRY1_CAMSI|nr:hypothetical protein HYC85_019826 [Camellia sinensis]